VENSEKDLKKAAMKKLRAERKNLIANASSIMKVQKKDITAIKDFLKDQAITVPDIAKGVNMPTDKTLFYIATMKKYGQIREDQKDGAFFKYSLNEPENSKNAEV